MRYALIVVLWSVGVGFAPATDYQWDGGYGLNWDTLSNWNGGAGFPGSAADNATFNNPGSGTAINLNGNRTVNSASFALSHFASTYYAIGGGTLVANSVFVHSHLYSTLEFYNNYTMTLQYRQDDALDASIIYLRASNIDYNGYGDPDAGTLYFDDNSRLILGNNNSKTITFTGIYHNVYTSVFTNNDLLTITGWDTTNSIFVTSAPSNLTLANITFQGYAPGAGIVASGGQFELVPIELAPVPEPASVLGLSAAGLAAAGWVRRRRAAP